MHQRVTSLEKLPPAIIAGRHLLWVLGDGVVGHVIGAVHGHVAHRVVHHVHGVIIRVTLVAREKLSPAVIAGRHLLGILSLDLIVSHLGSVHGHVSLGLVRQGAHVAGGGADEVVDLVDSRLEGGVRLVDDLGGLVDRLVRDVGNLVLGVRGSVLGLVYVAALHGAVGLHTPAVHAIAF